MSLPTQSDLLGLGWGADGLPFGLYAPGLGAETLSFGWGADGLPLNYAPATGSSDLTLAIAGSLATAKSGTATATTGTNVTATLAGVHATSRAGMLALALAPATAGQYAAAKAGTVTATTGGGTATPPSLDGTATNLISNVSSGTITLSTTKPNDIIVAVLSAETTTGIPPTISSVGSTSGLTWRKRSSTAAGSNGQEVWWALAPSALTNEVITATYTAQFDDWTGLAFGVNGCDTSAPWDANASLPAFDNIPSSSTAVALSVSGVSTTRADSFVFMAVAAACNFTFIPPDGFTAMPYVVNAGAVNYEYADVAYAQFTAPLSAQTVTWGAANTITGGASATVDALVAVPTIAPDSYALTGSKATSKAGTLTATVTVALPGSYATAKSGTVMATAGAHTVLTGDHATSRAGTVAVDARTVLTGVHATSRAGTVAATLAPTLAGDPATSRAGTVAATLALTLAGAHATGRAGAVTSALTLATTGARAASQAGMAVPGLALTPAGSKAAVSSGMLAPTTAIDTAGVSAVAMTGTVSATSVGHYPLTRARATAHAGTLKSATAYAKPLAGDHATGHIGAVGRTLTIALSGAHVTARAGMILPAHPLMGSSATSRSGTVAPNLTVALNGCRATVQAGRVRAGAGTGPSIRAVSRTVSALATIYAESALATTANHTIISILTPNNALSNN